MSLEVINPRRVGNPFISIMKEQLLKTWEIHQKMNELILNHLSEESLEKSLSVRGGRSIRQQFIHIHNVRLQWVAMAAPEISKNYKAIGKEQVINKEELLHRLSSSANAISQLFMHAWDQGGKIKGFKNGLIPMLGYFISHESHHRGNMMLTLKQSGEKIPDLVKWGLWEWGK